MRATDLRLWIISMCIGLFFLGLPSAHAGDAPQWMHALTSVPLPAHDDKTDAVLLYSERSVNVQSLDKIKTKVRL